MAAVVGILGYTKHILSCLTEVFLQCNLAQDPPRTEHAPNYQNILFIEEFCVRNNCNKAGQKLGLKTSAFTKVSITTKREIHEWNSVK